VGKKKPKVFSKKRTTGQDFEKNHEGEIGASRFWGSPREKPKKKKKPTKKGLQKRGNVGKKKRKMDQRFTTSNWGVGPRPGAESLQDHNV